MDNQIPYKQSLKVQENLMPRAKKVAKKGKQKEQVQDVENTQDLHQLIEVEAYLIAEQRGFQNGDPVADWYMAEEKINHGASIQI